MKWKNMASDTSTFFITATITQWQPLFLHEPARFILLADLDFYRRKYEAFILAYVVMPHHYHAVVMLKQPGDLHHWLRDVQSHVANELSKWLRSVVSGHLCPETAGRCSPGTPTGLQPNGVTIPSLRDMMVVLAKHANGSSKLAVWKEQARAVGITTERVLRTKIDYIHDNPVDCSWANLAEDWPWSSWRNYYLDDDSVFRVDRIDAFL
jgi:putative transposase